MTTRTSAHRELIKDAFLIIVGFGCAIIMSKAGVLDSVISFLGDGAAASFVAGIFFTSAFTIAPASVALVHIAGATDHLTVALWGALGALCGDLILFFFIRDKFAADLKRSFKPSVMKHVLRSLHFGFLKWLSPIIGALIIASPLPDELGIALMGISRTRLIILVPVSFVMNLLGIYALIWFAGLI